MICVLEIVTHTNKQRVAAARGVPAHRPPRRVCAGCALGCGAGACVGGMSVHIGRLLRNSIALKQDALQISVSVRSGRYYLDGAPVGAPRTIQSGTTVIFTDIPTQHPLQIMGASGDSERPGRAPTLEYTFARRGIHSMNCTNHGFMGGEGAFDVV